MLLGSDCQPHKQWLTVSGCVSPRNDNAWKTVALMQDCQPYIFSSSGHALRSKPSSFASYFCSFHLDEWNLTLLSCKLCWRQRGRENGCWSSQMNLNFVSNSCKQTDELHLNELIQHLNELQATVLITNRIRLKSHLNCVYTSLHINFKFYEQIDYLLKV